MLLQVPSTPETLPDSIPNPAFDLHNLANLPLDELIAKLVNALVTFAINLAIAILVFYVGRFLIRKVFNLVSGIMHRRKVDQSLSTFILSLINILLYFILAVTVIGILGIETTSFLAIFASAGVALGMALSGTLQNFAGGVLVLLLKPYRVGDFIEAQGYSGTVRAITMFSTIITTADNKTILLPNGSLSTGSINNWTLQPYRRVDWIVSISYGDDVDAASEVLINIAKADPRSVVDNLTHDAMRRSGKELTDAAIAVVPTDKLMEHTPAVVVKELGASSVDLRLSVWTERANYWGLYFDINKEIYKRLELEAGVHFPFPQLDVHLQQTTNA